MFVFSNRNVFVLLLSGRCCCYLSIHSPLLLPKKLEDAGTKAASSSGAGKQRAGTKGEQNQGVVSFEGEASVSEEQGSWWFGGGEEGSGLSGTAGFLGCG